MKIFNLNRQQHKNSKTKNAFALASLLLLFFASTCIQADSHATTLTSIATAAGTATITTYPLQKATPQAPASTAAALTPTTVPETASTIDPALIAAATDTVIAARDPRLRPRGTGGANATLLSRPGSSAPVPVVVSTSNATSTKGRNPHLNALPVANTATNGTDIGAASVFGYNGTLPGVLDPSEQGGLPKMTPITF